MLRDDPEAQKEEELMTSNLDMDVVRSAEQLASHILAAGRESDTNAVVILTQLVLAERLLRRALFPGSPNSASTIVRITHASFDALTHDLEQN
jgi:mRNA deadenylase 3'-5' endonuclease subunit Ccr4